MKRAVPFGRKRPALIRKARARLLEAALVWHVVRVLKGGRERREDKHLARAAISYLRLNPTKTEIERP
jgi:hypothetical protein